MNFDNIGGGLASRDGKPLDWFEIIDADEGGFVKADAQIDGASVVLSAPEVKHPVAMRYAWSMLAEPNLMNSDGLPAGAFRAGPVPKRDLLAHAKFPKPRTTSWCMIWTSAKLGRKFHYDVDNHKSITQPFDRIAYFMELAARRRQHRISVCFDGRVHRRLGKDRRADVQVRRAFSAKRGAPERLFQRQGDRDRHRIWPAATSSSGPTITGPANSAGVPNASGEVYDFGDQPSDPADGYGSMQVHNHDAKQTLFALNHWSEGSRADLGIGNQPAGNPDWTFAGNAGTYQVKRLRVLVRCR